MKNAIDVANLGNMEHIRNPIVSQMLSEMINKMLLLLNFGVIFMQSSSNFELKLVLFEKFEQV